MYKDNFEFKYIKLFKEDFLELDHIIKENFKEEDISIFFDTKNSRKEYKSFDEFYEQNNKTLNSLEKDIENISIRIINNTQRFMGKCVSVYISNLNIRVLIEDNMDDEIWVNGISQLFKNYFQKKSAPILKLNIVVPLIAGAFIGGGSTSFILLETSVMIKMLLLFVFFVGIILSNRKLVVKVLPNVKVSLGNKVKLNISEISGILGVVIALLSLVVTIIFNWI